jgi:hypothetical protein
MSRAQRSPGFLVDGSQILIVSPARACIIPSSDRLRRQSQSTPRRPIDPTPTVSKAYPRHRAEPWVSIIFDGVINAHDPIKVIDAKV